MGIVYERCRTCKYFCQHYTKRSTVFQSVECGHCVNPQLNGNTVRNKYALHANCEFWQSDKEKKLERREHIKEVLKNIEGHLNEIAIILKDDIN